jgi:hypothetical protein
MLVAGLFPNAAVARDWSGYPFGDPGEKIDLTTTFESVVEAAERVNRGDLGAVEAMLTAQSITLNAMFVHLSRGAYLSSHMDKKEQYLRLALKAQSQCRTTAEALAELKNPPVFTRQANIASQQVVNNGTLITGSRAGNSSIAQNGLLEAHGERLDGGEAGQADEGHPALAAVGTLDRPSDRGGKGAVFAERVPRRRKRDAPEGGQVSQPTLR